MAYAALVSLAQTTHLILNPHKYSVSVDAKQRIMCLHDYAVFVLSFLENYPAKANRFEALITDVTNKAEDILEYYMWNQIQSRMRRFAVGILRFKFEHRLEKATGEIFSIAQELMDIKISIRIEDDSLITDSSAAVLSSRNASTGENDIIIGLDEDLLAIKGRLCGESSKLEVIPIVGMGGIGKTTLARFAYDDPMVMEYFDIHAWVTVSQDYSVDEILSRIVDSMKLSEKNEMPMAEKVYKCLKGRRYLIVMDDVWSTEAWDDLRILFPDDSNGSRIMLTTRLSDVAAYPISESSLVHEMMFMDENQSWNLLKQKVFTKDQDCPSELKHIGKAISKSCRGLPLAVVLVAGILSAIANTRASWEEIAKNVISVVDGELEKILSLSYTHLPHHLRPCFLYIGGFPEDYEIHASRLIKLWVAEGFLRHDENGCKSLEEEAEECLEDLVKRSLVVVTRRKATGEIKSCSLHDLVRGSCIRQAQEEKFLLHVVDGYHLPKCINNKRRVSSISRSRFLKIQGPNIHTFLCLRLEDNSSLPAFVGRFRLLRVLDVVCTYLGLLPSQLFELIHLRYLALGTPQQIPAAISNLHNLQTLIINSKAGGFDKKLPLEIWRMQQLRHLVFPHCYKFPYPVDRSTLPLENLQTLSEVQGVSYNERILEMIPNLKKLEIVFFENQDSYVENLKYLHQLEKLKVSFYGCSWEWRTPAFPMMLKKLSLYSGCLPWKHMSVIGSLPNLQVLKLKRLAFHDISSQTWETADGEFPELRFLLIHDSRLEHWITESSHFPRLKCLVLRNCPRLQAIPDGIGEIPTLELIKVDDVNQSIVDSAKQILEEQLDYGNDTLRLRCIHVKQKAPYPFKYLTKPHKKEEGKTIQAS